VGDSVRRIAVKSILSVTGPESYLTGGRLGLGLVQVPRFHVQTHLDSGSMVQLLSDWPPPAVPVSLLYPRNRQLSARVRVFLDWAAREFAARNV
jgi:DNA-binding transcriptional LysR family regulator